MSEKVKRTKISLFFFLFLILIITMDGAIVIPNEVLIAAEFGFTSLFFIGILVGVYTIVSGVAVIFFGYLTDLTSRKNLLLFAGFLWSGTAILHYFITDFWQLIALRFLAAIAAGVTTPVAFSYLSDVISSDSRSKAFAFWGLITTVGSLLAGSVALAFNQIPYNEIESVGISENLSEIINNYPNLLDTWRLPFLMLGIIALIISILNLLAASEPKRAAKERDLREVLSNEDLQYSYKIKFSDLKFIYQRRSNLFLILNLFDVIGTGILTAYIFPYINLEMGISFGDPDGLSKLILLLLIAAPAGLIVGQFGLSHWADKKVQRGDLSGRVKVATICGILNLPFLLAALSMSPNVRNSTFFFGTLSVDQSTFWILWTIFAILLGVGLAFSLAIGPNWYSSLIDVNYPEHRGTMIAMASFLDTIGRSMGAIFGAIIITQTNSIAGTIFWASLIFGFFSTALWLPLLFYCDKDFNDVAQTLKSRAEDMKKIQEIESRKD
jgi:MFS family permease